MKRRRDDKVKDPRGKVCKIVTEILKKEITLPCRIWMEATSKQPRKLLFYGLFITG